MRTSESIGALAAALSKAQGAMRGAKRDGLNSHFGNRYASLDNLLEAATPALSTNGLCVVQAGECREAESGPPVGIVTTRLMHGSGEWIESTLEFPLAASLSYQELGKAQTYLRRYSLASLLGIQADADDDGETDLKARQTIPAQPAPRRTAPRPEAPAAGAGERVVVGTLKDVRQVPWQDTQKTSIRVEGVEDWCSTFDQVVGNWLAERRGRTVQLRIKANGKFLNIVNAVEVTPSDGEVEIPH